MLLRIDEVSSDGARFFPPCLGKRAFVHLANAQRVRECAHHSAPGLTVDDRREPAGSVHAAPSLRSVESRIVGRLMETTRTIDEESRRMFLETFEEVRINF